MPNKQKTENFYYSYDIKNTHFVALNSEIIKDKVSPEYILKLTTWLDNDLKMTTKKFKIVYMHRPLYCSRTTEDKYCLSDAEAERKIYEEIFMNRKVDLVITGHVHAYERMFPIYQNTVDTSSLSNDRNTYTNPKYPSYLVCGSTGLNGRYRTCIIN